MNKSVNADAIKKEFVDKTNELSHDVTQPIPGSKKIYVEGSRPDIQVPMREITQAATSSEFGEEENPPVTVYDTSGAYTDPNIKIDLLKGLSPIRDNWILERDDTEELDAPTSNYANVRLDDESLEHLRFYAFNI